MYGNLYLCEKPYNFLGMLIKLCMYILRLNNVVNRFKNSQMKINLQQTDVNKEFVLESSQNCANTKFHCFPMRKKGTEVFYFLATKKH